MALTFVNTRLKIVKYYAVADGKQRASLSRFIDSKVVLAGITYLLKDWNGLDTCTKNGKWKIAKKNL